MDWALWADELIERSLYVLLQCLDLDKVRARQYHGGILQESCDLVIGYGLVDFLRSPVQKGAILVEYYLELLVSVFS